MMYDPDAKGSPLFFRAFLVLMVVVPSLVALAAYFNR